MMRRIISRSDDETLEAGRAIASTIQGGEILMLRGGLGAGKTLLTKGILDGLGFDMDEVTSPSFTLVNRYPTHEFDIYHIDLWRLEGPDPDVAVGLSEILSDQAAVVIIEWSERLENVPPNRKIITIDIEGDGDDPRSIRISE
jgi:tRNA threonylcarbamoyladenosine biosynthesis protein TsaE